MNNMAILALAYLGGAALAAAFLSGLWWTIKLGATSRFPALWFLGSFVLRTTFVTLGFFFLVQYGLGTLGAALLGFTTVKLAVLYRSRKVEAS